MSQITTVYPQTADQLINGSAESASYAATASYIRYAVTGTIDYAISASFAKTASYASNGGGGGPSISASYALTASYASNGGGGSSPSSSWASSSVSASYATTASAATSITFIPSSATSASWASSSISASYALTASYASNGGGGSSPSSSWASSSISASYATTAGTANALSYTPSTASYSATASAATSITFTPSSASYATTASYARDAGYLTIPATNTLYVDMNRVDAYTANGSISKPFKTIQAAVNTISGSSISNRYKVDIAPGVYPENISVSSDYVLFAGTWYSRLTGNITVNNPVSRIRFSKLQLEGNFTAILSASSSAIDIDDCSVYNYGALWTITSTSPLPDISAKQFQVYNGNWMAHLVTTNMTVGFYGSGARFWSTYDITGRAFYCDGGMFQAMTINLVDVPIAIIGAATCVNNDLYDGATQVVVNLAGNTNLTADADFLSRATVTNNGTGIIEHSTKALNITNTPTGSITATNVQGAINQLYMGPATSASWASSSISATSASWASSSISASFATTASAATSITFTPSIPASKIIAGTFGAGNYVVSGNLIVSGTTGTAGASVIGPVTFGGVGLNDLTLGGNFTTPFTQSLYIKITAVGVPDKFGWSINNGASWIGTSGSIVAGPTALGQTGVIVTFAATTGHTINDYWQSALIPPTGKVNTEGGYYISNSLFATVAGPKGGAIILGREAMGRGQMSDFPHIAIGYRALYSHGDGTSNIAIGDSALACNTNGNSNIAIGSSALSASIIGGYNIAIGSYACQKNAASSNIGIGRSVLSLNINGADNIGIGLYSLYSNTTSYNVGIGSSALYGNSIGTNNTAVGYQVLYTNTSGSNNTVLGYKALYSQTSGSNNTILGTNALTANTSGSNNTVVGNDTTGVAGMNNSILLGRGAAGTGSGQFVIGCSTYPVSHTYFGGIYPIAAGVGLAHTLHGMGGNGTDRAGGNLVIAAGQGTGTGLGGSIIFQIAAASASTGAISNPLATSMALLSTGIILLTGSVVVSGSITMTAGTLVGSSSYATSASWAPVQTSASFATSSSYATSATSISSIFGIPTEVPTTPPGTVAIVYNTANDLLYVYNNAAWKSCSLA